MSRRQTMVGLALIAAIAVAVPSIAASKKDLNFKRVSIQARKLSKQANKKANKALKRANKALKQGGGAGSVPGFAQVDGTVTTDETAQFVSLGGPSVTVTVPQATNGAAGTGFIEVVASARVSDEAGAVALYQDGVNLSENEQCELALSTPGPPLFASLDTLGGPYGTPGSLDPITGMCATTGDPGPVTFITTPGQHTYELRYSYCGCSGTDADFSQRRLWVTPLG
jgi:hypothetical protein